MWYSIGQLTHITVMHLNHSSITLHLFSLALYLHSMNTKCGIETETICMKVKKNLSAFLPFRKCMYNGNHHMYALFLEV